MLRTVAKILGVVVALLAVIGFFVEGDHLFGIMNVDIALDILRVLIAAALLFAGFGNTTARTIRTVVLVVGVMYVLMGLLAFASPTMFGLLPTGFTGFDIGFHLVVGAGSIAAALVPMSNTAAGGSRTRTAH